MRITGGASTITINHTGAGTALILGNDSTVFIEPTANGVAGLSTINVTAGNTSISATNTTLELDVSSYTPVVGDSWDVVTSADISFSSVFSTLAAPAGFAISQSTPLVKGVGARVLRITVTDAPVPQVPVWGFIGVLAAIAFLGCTGIVYIRRRTA